MRDSDPTRSVIEQHANAHRDGGFARVARKPAGRGVDFENGEDVRILMAAHEPLAVRREGEVAWDLAARRNDFDRRKFAGSRIDCEDGDAVMTAIRRIEELAAGMDADLGGPTCFETRGQRRDGLD